MEQNKIPLVSIAMTTYNGEQYLCDQIDSILSQSMSDWELVICDDCSTDGTWQILSKYAESDGRIRIFRNKTNLGFNRNFEQAITLCTGEYVALSDQDDKWTCDKLETCLAAIGNNVLVCSDSEFIASDGSLLYRTMTDSLYIEELPSDPRTMFIHILSTNFVQGATVFARREFLLSCIPFPPDVFYDWWIGCCALADGGVKYIGRPLLLYRQHEGTVTTRVVARRSFFQRLLGYFSFDYQKVEKERAKTLQALSALEGNERFTQYEKEICEAKEYWEAYYSLSGWLYYIHNYYALSFSRNLRKKITRILRGGGIRFLCPRELR